MARHAYAIAGVLLVAGCNLNDKEKPPQTPQEAITALCGPDVPAQIAPRLDPVHDQSRFDEMFGEELRYRVSNPEIGAWMMQIYGLPLEQRELAMRSMLEKYQMPSTCPVLLTPPRQAQ